jgi:hypothetical protein
MIRRHVVDEMKTRRGYGWLRDRRWDRHSSTMKSTIRMIIQTRFWPLSGDTTRAANSGVVFSLRRRGMRKSRAVVDHPQLTMHGSIASEDKNTVPMAEGCRRKLDGRSSCVGGKEEESADMRGRYVVLPDEA